MCALAWLCPHSAGSITLSAAVLQTADYMNGQYNVSMCGLWSRGRPYACVHTMHADKRVCHADQSRKLTDDGAMRQPLADRPPHPDSGACAPAQFIILPAHPLRCNARRWLCESSELCAAAAAAVLLKPSRLNSRHHPTVLAFPCALAATTVGRS